MEPWAKSIEFLSKCVMRTKPLVQNLRNVFSCLSLPTNRKGSSNAPEGATGSPEPLRIRGSSPMGVIRSYTRVPGEHLKKHERKLAGPFPGVVLERYNMGPC